jgi:hypothetical protein
MPAKPKDVDVSASLPVPGMKPTRLEYQAIEDEQEKALRLHKERYAFYAKELSVWILAPLFIVIAWSIWLWILMTGGFSSTEKDRAWTAFMAITSGAVGVYFGKQIGK